ncbi:MAG TPA: tetratricopeptide repeat protein [Candidatus Marinimicrobia bacterium]|nr:tetratricopeptide repeat protein [Candidatus Neomarinimicrobiota bacterium]
MSLDKRLIIIILLATVLYAQSDWTLFLKQKKQDALSIVYNSQGFEKAIGLLGLGEMDAFAEMMEKEILNPAERLILEARLLMSQRRYEEAADLLQKVKKRQRQDEWYFAWYETLEYCQNDLLIEKSSRAKMRKRKAGAVHLLVHSRWLIQQLRLDEAEKYIESIYTETEKEQRELLHLKMMLEMQRYNYQEAWVYADSLIREPFLDAPLLSSAGQILIHLNRVNDAISAFEASLRLDNLNEAAHYMLGNGYTRYNYSELEEKYPGRFVLATSQRDSFLLIQEKMAQRDYSGARKALLDWTQSNKQYVEPYLWLGVLDWEQGENWGAIEFFQRALDLVPNYGRAHAGLAKALEAIRMKSSVYRAGDDREFIRETRPEVPDIDKYILNWHELSPRHQKKIALSVAPLEKYIPVLLASGSYHYIKPLYMKLSEVPSLAILKDQRISYDSRLWDDVRGCGGYTTVTGIEDVERMIYYRYNTIIHEMTHQVHSILTSEEKEDIEKLYLEAKEAEANGAKRFVSRYQKASVWEYLAEGVNGSVSPQRNQYDSREITLERLNKLDPSLHELVKKLKNPASIEPYYAVGLANAIYHQMENADTLEMKELIRQAKSKAYQSLDLDAAAAYATLIIHGADSAENAITELLEKYPLQQQAYQIAFTALTLKGESPAALIDTLEKQIIKMSLRQQIEGRLLLARKYLELKRYSKALEVAKTALTLDETLEEAYWILGSASSALGDSASSLQYFKRAISYRNGIIDLRADFAESLLKFAMIDEARQQLDEIYSLNRSHYRTFRTEALMSLAQNDTISAMTALNKTLEENRFDLSSAILMAALKNPDDGEMPDSLKLLINQPPYFWYNAKWMQYTLANVWTPAIISYASELFPGDKELKKLDDIENDIRIAPKKKLYLTK